MFICSNCSFSTVRKYKWEDHRNRLGHTLEITDQDEPQNVSFGSDLSMQDVDNRDVCEGEVNLDVGEDNPDVGEDDLDEAYIEDNPPTPEGDYPPEAASWHPFKSRSHFYLTVLYHGSHRRYCQILHPYYAL